MPDRPSDQYEIDEPDDSPVGGGPADSSKSSTGGASARPPIGRGIPRAEEVEHIRIEEEEEPQSRKASVRDLDVCPSCGGTMRGSEDLVCIRCGFDLKTMKKVSTVTGAVEVSDAPAGDELEPIIKPGNGEYWLPTILAAISGLLLLIGYLAGASSLFPNLVAATEEGKPLIISAGQRIQAILQLIVVISMLTACGLGALAFTAYLNGMRLCKNWDHLQLGAVRMLAIAVTMRLAAFIALPRPFEWMAEVVLQLAVFAGLSIALFRLKPKDAPIFTGAMAMLFMVMWLFAWVIVWGTW